MPNGWPTAASCESPPTPGCFVAELIKRYREHVRQHYVKNGKPTSEQHDIACALRFVRELYHGELVTDFGPLALKAVRHKMVEAGYARSTVNDSVHRIRRMFRWGVENELVTPSILQALEAVTALAKGKTDAHETEPVGPIADTAVDATLPHLPVVVADMVRFQRLTGCRPQEVCLIRPCDVDTSNLAAMPRPADCEAFIRGHVYKPEYCQSGSIRPSNWARQHNDLLQRIDCQVVAEFKSSRHFRGSRLAPRSAGLAIG